MRKIKKFFGVVFAMAMSMSMSMVVLAAGSSDQKTVPGYGTLSGSISAGGTYGNYQISAPTNVTTNPDNAYIRVKITIEDIYGTELDSDHKDSARGVTSYPGPFPVVNFDDVHAIYAAHNIQGGRTYEAQVVYTVTTTIPD